MSDASPSPPGNGGSPDRLAHARASGWAEAIGRMSPIAQGGLLAIALFVVARLAAAVTPVDDLVPLAWLGNAIGLVGLVLYGLRLWPAVTIGALAYHLAILPTPGVAIVAALADTIAVAGGAWLLGRAGSEFDPRLHRLRDVLALGLGAALAASLVPATAGVVSLLATQALAPASAATTWLGWWAGTAQGILIVAPLLFTWRDRATNDREAALAIASGAVLGLSVAFVPGLLQGELGAGAARELVGFALFPLALALAARITPRSVAAFNAVVAVAAFAGHLSVAHGTAPDTTLGGLVALHSFLAFLVIATLTFSAVQQERRGASEALVESEARFRSLTEMGNDWYWEQDASLAFIVASNGIAAIGIEPEAVVGKRLEGLPFEIPGHVLAAHQRLTEGRRPFRDLMLRRRMEGGEVRYFLWSGDPIFAPDGAFAGYRGVGREITAEKWAEEALRESEQRYASIFHNSAAAIVVLRVEDAGDDYVVESCNPTGEALFESRAYSLVGHSLESALPAATAAQLLERLRACVGAGTRVTEQIDLALAGGTRRVVTTLVPTRKAGRVDRILLIAIDVTEQVRAEERVRESERLFSEVFDGSPEAMMFSRLADGAIREVNVAWERMFEVPRAQAVGRALDELGLVADPAHREEMARRLAAGENIREIDAPYRTASGRIVYVRYSGQVIDLRGEPTIVSTFIDVTERRRAESQLRESRERFVKIFQSSPLPVVISRREDGRYLEVNDAFCRFFGLSREEAIGRSAVDLGIWVSNEDRQRAFAPLFRGQPVRDVEIRLRKRSGELVDTLLSADVFELDGEPRVAACMMDITDRKRAERHLRESERRFRDFAAAAGEFVWELDADRRFTFASDRIEQVLGYRPDEILGRTPYDLMPPGEPERVQQWEAQHRSGDGSFRNLECRAITRNGTTVWLQMSGIAVTDSDARFIGLRGTALDITERKLAAQRIEDLATRDPLTGLPNRLLLQDRLQQGIAAATRSGGNLAVMFIDLDHFKRINDTLGHHVGDGLLKEVARRLSTVIRKGDTLARIGGDEFVIVLEGLKSSVDAGQVAQKVLGSLAQPCEVDGHVLSTGGSVGISLCPVDGVDVATLMRHADTAMYAAKSGGRGSYQFFATEMNTRVSERAQLEADLRRALDNHELRVHFQPRMEIASGAITGIEALLRWRHPREGLVTPDRFLQVAEDTGLLAPIGDWVFDAAIAQGKVWNALGDRVLPIGVNVSPRQFTPRLVETVRAALERHAVPPALLEIEVTEQTLMRSIDEAGVIVARLRQLGCRVLVDDFGTGYSSLAYLRRLSVNGVKIDRSLIHEVVRNPDDRVVVKAIVEVARSFGIAVIAEGIETAEQLEALREIGCSEYLGNLFMPAGPAADVERLLARGANVASLAAHRGSA